MHLYIYIFIFLSIIIIIINPNFLFCFFLFFIHSCNTCLFISSFASFDATKSTKGASKLRRDLINSEIANLRDLLPLPSSTRQRLSQLQLMALVCVYVRKANYFQNGKSVFVPVCQKCFTCCFCWYGWYWCEIECIMVTLTPYISLFLDYLNLVAGYPADHVAIASFFLSLIIILDDHWKIMSILVTTDL